MDLFIKIMMLCLLWMAAADYIGFRRRNRSARRMARHMERYHQGRMLRRSRGVW